MYKYDLIYVDRGREREGETPRKACQNAKGYSNGAKQHHISSHINVVSL